MIPLHRRSTLAVRLAALTVMLAGARAALAADPQPPPRPEAHELMLDHGGLRIFLRTIGGRYAGPTLIVLHGGPGLSHEYLAPLEALASDSYRVAFYDQRGAGRSSPPPTSDDNRLDQYGDDLEAVRAALGTDKVDLLGHSWGGMVAMDYATRHPEHVRSLLFVGSGPPRYNDMNAGKWYFNERVTELQGQHLIPEPLPPVDGDDCANNLTALLPAYFFDPHHPATRDLAGASCHLAVGLAAWKANAWYDFTDALAALRVPTLVVQGANDPFRKQMSDAILAALKAAKPQAAILPRCGHIPWEECPEPFFARVRAFLAKRP